MKHLKRTLALLLALSLSCITSAMAASGFYDEEGYARYTGNITIVSEGMIHSGQT